MKRIIVATFAVFVLASGIQLLAQEQITYYPLKAGSKWIYDVGGQEMVLRVTGFENVGGVKCAVLESRTENQVFTEHVAIEMDGIYRYKADGAKIEPKVCFFKLPPQQGLKWEVDAKTGNVRVHGDFRMSAATVAVPAGDFKTYVSTFHLKQGGQDVSISMYLAPGVGMVMQTMDIAGKEVLVQLKKYEEGK